MKLFNYIFDFLAQVNIKDIFGIPGVHNIDMYDDLNNNDRKYHLISNEQSVGHQCHGLFKANATIACVNIIGGPGVTHAFASIADAFLSKIPIFIVIIEKKSNITGNKFQIHDVNNEQILRNIVCGIKTIVQDDLDNMTQIMENLYETMITNQQPVVLIIPNNFVKCNIITSEYIRPNTKINTINKEPTIITAGPKCHKQQETDESNIFVTDDYLCEDKNMHRIHSATNISGFSIAASIGCYLSKKYYYVFCEATINSLLISGMELINIDPLDNKTKIIIFVPKNDIVNLEEFAKSINFDFQVYQDENPKESQYFKYKKSMIIEIPYCKPKRMTAKAFDCTIYDYLNEFLKDNSINKIYTNQETIDDVHGFVDFLKMKKIKVINEQNIYFTADGNTRSNKNKVTSCVVTSNEIPGFLSGVGEAKLDGCVLFGIIIDCGGRINYDDAISALCNNYFIINNKKDFEQFSQINHLLKQNIRSPIIVKIKFNALLNDMVNTNKYTLQNNSVMPKYVINVDSVANAINNAKCPVLYVGYGCIDSTNEIKEVISKSNMLVATTFSGKGIFSETSKNWLSCGFNSGINHNLKKIIEQIDLVIMVGVKTSEMSVGHYTSFLDDIKTYHIDIDQKVFNMNINAIPILCDAKIFFEELNRANIIKKDNRIINDLQIKKIKVISDETTKNSNFVLPYNLAKTVQRRNTIYTTDAGNGTLLATEFLQLDIPGYLGPIDYCSMGYAIPASIGAVGAKNNVVCFEGDGALLMNWYELITAKLNKMPLVVIVLRDNELGMISGIQEKTKKRKCCTMLNNYNLVNLCKAISINYYKISNNHELVNYPKILNECNKNHEPVVIECMIDYSHQFSFAKGVSGAKAKSQIMIPINNKFKIESDGHNMFFNILQRGNKIFKHKIAVVDDYYKKELTYEMLYKNCLDMGSFLSEYKNNLVGVLLHNSHHVIIMHYAIAMGQKCVLNVNIKLKPDELKHIFNDCGVKMLITEKHFEKDLQTIIAGTHIEHIIWIDNATPIISSVKNHDYNKIVDVSSKQSYFVNGTTGQENYQLYYTSGTTGKPKGVMLSYDNVFKHMLGITIEMRIVENDVWLHVSPMYHLVDAFGIFALPYVGAKQIIQRNFTPDETLTIIQKYNITVTNMASIMGQMIAGCDTNNYKCNMRLLSCGGAPLNENNIKKLKNIFKCEYFTSYGMTECCGKISMSMQTDVHQENKYNLTSGREFALTELRIVDSVTGDELENNMIGEVQIRGNTLFKDYLNKESEHDNYFTKNGWFKTGDLALMNNGYITVVDRLKDMILVCSENVYSIEVENVLNMHPNVSNSAVYGIPDLIYGEKICAAVILTNVLSDTELKAHCRKYLADYKIPHIILREKEFPMTGTGKINKVVLKEQNNMTKEVVCSVANNTLKEHCHIVNYEKIKLNYGMDKSYMTIKDDAYKTYNFTINGNASIIYYTTSNAVTDINNYFNFFKKIIEHNVKNIVCVIVDSENSPYQTSIYGMFRVFCNEYLGNAVLVDIPNVEYINKVIEYQLFENNTHELKYINDEFYIPRLKNYNINYPEYKVNGNGRDECIIITGGTGGIGKQLINYLCANGFTNIIVLSRQETTMSTNKYVEFVKTDDINCLIKYITTKYKRCKYLFHLAGKLQDKHIKDLDWQTFNEVLEPKITLFEILLNKFSKCNFAIEKNILFSSIYALFGYAQLSNYATANMYLNGIAKKYDNVLTINWGTWDEFGMAHRLGLGFKKYWQAQGMDFIIPAEGLEMLFYFINQGSVKEIGIFPLNKEKFGLSTCVQSLIPMAIANKVVTSSIRVNKESNVINKFMEIFNNLAGECFAYDEIKDKSIFEIGIDSLNFILLTNQLTKSGLCFDKNANIVGKFIIDNDVVDVVKNEEINDNVGKFIDIVNQMLDTDYTYHKIMDDNLSDIGIDSLNYVMLLDKLKKANIKVNSTEQIIKKFLYVKENSIDSSCCITKKCILLDAKQSADSSTVVNNNICFGGYLTEFELKNMGFKKYGTNVKISRKCSVYSPQKIEFGDDVRIDDFCIVSPGNGYIKIGKFVHIGGHVYINGAGGVVIDDFAGLSHKVSIFSGSDDFSGEFMSNPCVGEFNKDLVNVTLKEIRIGKHVMIGAGSTVLPGCSICDNTSIGSMSLVNKKIDSAGIYFGVPVKFLKAVSDGRIRMSKKYFV